MIQIDFDLSSYYDKSSLESGLADFLSSSKIPGLDCSTSRDSHTLCSTQKSRSMIDSGRFMVKLFCDKSDLPCPNSISDVVNFLKSFPRYSFENILPIHSHVKLYDTMSTPLGGSIGINDLVSKIESKVLPKYFELSSKSQNLDHFLGSYQKYSNNDEKLSMITSQAKNELDSKMQSVSDWLDNISNSKFQDYVNIPNLPSAYSVLYKYSLPEQTYTPSLNSAIGTSGNSDFQIDVDKMPDVLLSGPGEDIDTGLIQYNSVIDGVAELYARIIREYMIDDEWPTYKDGYPTRFLEVRHISSSKSLDNAPNISKFHPFGPGYEGIIPGNGSKSLEEFLVYNLSGDKYDLNDIENLRIYKECIV